MTPTFVPARPRGLSGLGALTLAATALTTFAAPAAHAAGTAYYVSASAGSDTNSGTSPDAPWKSLAQVGRQTFQPGDTVAFRSGDTWTGQLAPHGSGTAAAPITFTSYGTGARPKLDGQGAVASVVLLANQHDVTVSNFEISNSAGPITSSTPYRIGVNVFAQDVGAVPGIRITDNYVHDVDAPPNSSNPGSGGIIYTVRGSATPTYFTGLTVRNNEVANIASYGISGWSTWMQRDGWTSLWPFLGAPTTEYRPFTPSTGTVISNNYVHGIAAGGIAPLVVRDTMVDHNTVADTAQAHGNVAIWWADADNTTVQFNEISGTKYNGPQMDGDALDADEDSRGSLVQYNYSHDNGGGFFISVSGDSAPATAVVRYNVSQNDRNEIFTFSTNTTSVQVYNNTVWVSPNSGAAMTALTAVYHNATGVTMANNIIHNAANLPYNTGSAITYDRNWYDGGPVPATDRAALTGNPGLTAPGTATSIADLAGYRPTATSPILQQGLEVPNDGGRDAVGAALPQGMPDLGALQRTAGTGLTEAAPTVTGSYATGQGTLAAVADGSDASSWASPSSGVAMGGNLTLAYPNPRTVSQVELATHFGTGQGITRFDVQYWNGSAWVTALADATVAWSSNSAAVERRSVTLPAPVTTGQLRLVVRAANLQWGNFAVNEIGTR
ncbi:right-handed parallel beta-helix repeat-containing protein [Kitasatospora griseola]|uniref:right-handed parallel beta-helix repeat-containing protein n=1 Tax=Kitasatospora griseola TaxID=2064 RepID=UPI0036DA9C54